MGPLAAAVVTGSAGPARRAGTRALRLPMVRHNGRAMTDPAATPDTTDAPDSTTATGQTARPARGSRWQAFRRAPRAVRWTAWTALGLVVLLLVLAVTVVVVVRRPLPQTDGEIEVPGLSASVDVVRDANGIAQVYADTDADLMLAQGYVHAQDRFFEMDVRRHMTAGRLSEIFGRTPSRPTGSSARWAGGGSPRASGRCSSRTTRDALAAYAEGVNAYIGDAARPSSQPSTPPRRSPGSTTRPRSGRRSTRWPGSRRWRGTCAATWTPRSTGSCSPSTTPTTRSPHSGPNTPRRPPADRRQRRGRRRRLRAERDGNATRNPRRPAYPDEVVAALERCATGSTGSPA